MSPQSTVLGAEKWYPDQYFIASRAALPNFCSYPWGETQFPNFLTYSATHFTKGDFPASICLPKPHSTGYQSAAARWQGPRRASSSTTQPTATDDSEVTVCHQGVCVWDGETPVVTPNVQNAFMLDKASVFGYLFSVICMTREWPGEHLPWCLASTMLRRCIKMRGNGGVKHLTAPAIHFYGCEGHTQCLVSAALWLYFIATFRDLKRNSREGRSQS